MHMCSVNNVAFNHHVFVNEIGGIGIVRHNTAHFCRRQINLVNLFGGKEFIHGLAIEQVELIASTQNQIHVFSLLKLADNGRTDHSPVARHKNTLSGHFQDSSAIATS